jgi:hypothetical protein
VSEFVQECLREWRRLGVPDAVANEMAADLSADLDEAEAEGGSPEDVLGNSAFDPRRFAAAWAVARGVTGPPIPDPAPAWRSPVTIALSVVLALLAIGAALVLAVGVRRSSVSVAMHRFVTGPGPIRGQIQIPGGLGPPFVRSQIAGGNIFPIALLMLFMAIVGLAVLAALLWSPRFGLRRNRRDRDRGPRTPSWS